MKTTAIFVFFGLFAAISVAQLSQNATQIAPSLGLPPTANVHDMAKVLEDCWKKAAAETSLPESEFKPLVDIMVFRRGYLLLIEQDIKISPLISDASRARHFAQNLKQCADRDPLTGPLCRLLNFEPINPIY